MSSWCPNRIGRHTTKIHTRHIRTTHIAHTMGIHERRCIFNIKKFWCDIAPYYLPELVKGAPHEIICLLVKIEFQILYRVSHLL